jgi:hypothetical protein
MAEDPPQICDEFPTRNQRSAPYEQALLRAKPTGTWVGASSSGVRGVVVLAVVGSPGGVTAD